jgi:hypothetical protein
MDLPTRVTLPKPYKVGQGFRIQFRPAEEMHMIRHDNVPTNGPSMSFMSRAPFVNENLGAVVVGQNRLPMANARCHKINWSIDQNAV